MRLKASLIVLATVALASMLALAAAPTGATLSQGASGGNGLAGDPAIYVTSNPGLVASQEAAQRNANKLVEFVTRMHFDVTTFGAVPGDSGDDAEEINDAIDAASAAGGGTVFIPKGVWIVSAESIKLKPGVRVRGAGMYDTVIRLGAGPTGGSGQTAFTYWTSVVHRGWGSGGAYGIVTADYIDQDPDTNSNFYISDLTIDGDNDTLDLSIGLAGLAFIQCSDIEVERVRAIDCGPSIADEAGQRASGIVGIGVYRMTVRSPVTERNGYEGIGFRESGASGDPREGCRDVAVYDARCYDDARHAIAIQPETDGFIIDGAFTDQTNADEGGDGIIVHRGRRGMVTNFHSITKQGGVYIHDIGASSAELGTFDVTYANGIVDALGTADTGDALPTSGFDDSQGSELSTRAGIFIFGDFTRDITVDNVRVNKSGENSILDYGAIVADGAERVTFKNVVVETESLASLWLLDVADFKSIGSQYICNDASASAEKESCVVIGDYQGPSNARGGGDWGAPVVRPKFIGDRFYSPSTDQTAMVYLSHFKDAVFQGCHFDTAGTGGTDGRGLSFFRTNDTTAANRDGLFVNGCIFDTAIGIRSNGVNAVGQNICVVGNNFTGVAGAEMDIQASNISGAYRVSANLGVADASTAP